MDHAAQQQFIDQLFTDLNNDSLVLPTLPEIALKVQDTLKNPESSLADVAKIITQDAAISARLIQVVNSPLLRGYNTIEDVNSAVTRMGSTMIRNLVTSMAMEQLFKTDSPVTAKLLRATWENSVAVSSFAFSLAKGFRHLKIEADQAMLAGLVHNIGILPILAQAQHNPDLLRDKEALDNIIEQAHPAIGAAILRKWHFSDEFVMVAVEHQNLQYNSENGPDYTDVVIVSTVLSSGKLNPSEQASIPAFQKLGLANEVEVIDMTECEELTTAMLT